MPAGTVCLVLVPNATCVYVKQSWSLVCDLINTCYSTNVIVL